MSAAGLSIAPRIALPRPAKSGKLVELQVFTLLLGGRDVEVFERQSDGLVEDPERPETGPVQHVLAGTDREAELIARLLNGGLQTRSGDMEDLVVLLVGDVAEEAELPATGFVRPLVGDVLDARVEIDSRPGLSSVPAVDLVETFPVFLHEDLPDAAGAAAVSLMLELASDEVYRLRYQAGQAWAQQAVDAAKAIGDPALDVAALAMLARALSWGGEPIPGEQARAEAAAILDLLTDEQLAGHLGAVVELAGAEIYVERFVEAGAHAERALAVGRATGQGQLFPGIYATLGVAWCMVGRLADAAELLDAAIEAARLSGHPPALA